MTHPAAQPHPPSLRVPITRMESAHELALPGVLVANQSQRIDETNGQICGNHTIGCRGASPDCRSLAHPGDGGIGAGRTERREGRACPTLHCFLMAGYVDVYGD